MTTALIVSVVASITFVLGYWCGQRGFVLSPLRLFRLLRRRKPVTKPASLAAVETLYAKRYEGKLEQREHPLYSSLKGPVTNGFPRPVKPIPDEELTDPVEKSSGKHRATDDPGEG